MKQIPVESELKINRGKGRQQDLARTKVRARSGTRSVKQDRTEGHSKDKAQDQVPLKNESQDQPQSTLEAPLVALSGANEIKSSPKLTSKVRKPVRRKLKYLAPQTPDGKWNALNHQGGMHSFQSTVFKGDTVEPLTRQNPYTVPSNKIILMNDSLSSLSSVSSSPVGVFGAEPFHEYPPTQPNLQLQSYSPKYVTHPAPPVQGFSQPYSGSISQYTLPQMNQLSPQIMQNVGQMNHASQTFLQTQHSSYIPSGGNNQTLFDSSNQANEQHYITSEHINRLQYNTMNSADAGHYTTSDKFNIAQQMQSFPNPQFQYTSSNQINQVHQITNDGNTSLQNNIGFPYSPFQHTGNSINQQLHIPSDGNAQMHYSIKSQADEVHYNTAEQINGLQFSTSFPNCQPQYDQFPQFSPPPGNMIFQHNQSQPPISQKMNSSVSPLSFNNLLMMSQNSEMLGIMYRNYFAWLRKVQVKSRTRTGCLTCRKRRIKCDERKPGCLNCERSNHLCLGYEKLEQKVKRRKRDTSLDILKLKDDTHETTRGQKLQSGQSRVTRKLSSIYNLMN